MPTELNLIGHMDTSSRKAQPSLALAVPARDKLSHLIAFITELLEPELTLIGHPAWETFFQA